MFQLPLCNNTLFPNIFLSHIQVVDDLVRCHQEKSIGKAMDHVMMNAIRQYDLHS